MGYNPNQPSYGQAQSTNPADQSPAYGQMPSYSPQPPLASFPPRKKSRRWLWIIPLILVLLIGGGIAAVILTVSNSPAKTAVQNYYNAVEQQDYATAYTYLGIQTLTINGQQQAASQDLYTQASQSVDQALGTVTAYKITGISLNSSTDSGNTAAITVEVTRGGKVREVHLQLQQMDKDWIIVGIDQF